MTWFQRIACGLIALELVRELVSFARHREGRRALLVRSAVWLAALVGIVDPSLVTRFANVIGIGRGADVVLYLFVLAFVASTFFFYTRQVRLQRQLDALNSRLAQLTPLRGAEVGEHGSKGPGPTGAPSP